MQYTLKKAIRENIKSMDKLFSSIGMENTSISN